MSEWRVKVNVHKLAVSKYENRCDTEHEHLLALASATVHITLPLSFTMHHVNISSCKLLLVTHTDMASHHMAC